MADKTKISWTEATWNPIIGCARVSEGCRNCYAEVQAKRIALMHPGSAYEGVLRRDASASLLPMWNGKVTLMPERLDQPIRWKRPRLIFVNSMSDLFHDDVPFDFIDRVFDVIEKASWHTFQLLTKRAKRMLSYLSDRRRALPRNAWLGVSCENQKAANERVPLLLKCRPFAPDNVLWVSAEPLLGPIDFDAIDDGNVMDLRLNALRGYHDAPGPSLGHHLDWIVVGGESGHEARPCRVDWIRNIVDDCRAAGVAVYVKQVGAVAMERALIHGEDDHHWRTRHPKGGDPAEWPMALNVQEYPKTP